MPKVSRKLKLHLKKLPQRKAELERQFPNATVELWSSDEHRLGLKPIVRKVWALIGERPVAVVHS